MCVEGKKNDGAQLQMQEKSGEKAVLGEGFSFLDMPGSKKPLFDQVAEGPDRGGKSKRARYRARTAARSEKSLDEPGGEDWK